MATGPDGGVDYTQGPTEASLDPRVRAPRPEKQLIPIPVQMGKQGPRSHLEMQGQIGLGQGRGPRCPCPHPSGMQPQDAALPHSHSSTSSSSSTLSGCSPPSCGKPTPAGVTRGNSTGEPRLPCQAPQSSCTEAKMAAPRMSLFQGENPAPDSLAVPTQQ